MSDPVPPFDPLEWIRVLAQLLGDIAWPVAFMAVFFALREELVALLPGLRRFKGPGGVEFEFGKDLEGVAANVEDLAGAEGQPGAKSGPPTQLELSGHAEGTSEAEATPPIIRPGPGPWELVSSLVEVSPATAIVAAWAMVDQEVRDLSQRRMGLEPHTVIQALRVLADGEMISDRTAGAVLELQRLRTEVGQGEVAPPIARRYIETAKRLVRLLGRPPVRGNAPPAGPP